MRCWAMGIVLVYRTSRVLNIAGGEFAIFIGYVAAAVAEANCPFAVALLAGMAARSGARACSCSGSPFAG